MRSTQAGSEESHPPARKRWGQNFLVDPRAVERILDALAVAPGEAVLEIGPGRGALTGGLIERAGRIAAVELDPLLAIRLRATFGDDRLVLLEGDILTTELAHVRAMLGRSEPEPVAVVGNLPYSISKPIASKLVRERAQVARAVLMFQREVADRLVAVPDTSEYGPLTVLVGAAFRVERLFDLSPGAFRPSPKVRSSVLRWLPLPAAAFPLEDEAPLRRVLAASFAHRRQTILKNLRAVLPGGERSARELLAGASIDGALRAEAVAPDGFRLLAKQWPKP